MPLVSADAVTKLTLMRWKRLSIVMVMVLYQNHFELWDNKAMKSRFLSRITLGEMLLIAYLVIVGFCTALRDIDGPAVIAALSSTPAALLHGQWWTLFTSGLVVDGPAVPQVATLSVLAVLALYFRGSMVFWSVAFASHIAGTLLTYAGIGLVWLMQPGWVHGLIRQPDYGISLVWCGALGIVSAAAWLGPNEQFSDVFRPLTLIATLLIMVAVTWYSPGLSRFEHLAAFTVAFLIAATTSQHRHASQTLASRHR